MKKTLLIAWTLALSAFGLVVGMFVIRGSVTSKPSVSIQSLINAAHDGDTVNVPTGFNTESLTIDKSITLTGVSSSTTAIYAVTGSRVITITSGHRVILQNLTLAGGRAGAAAGGGVYVDSSSSLRILSCTLTNNSAGNGGAVFQSGAGRIDVINSLFQGNSTDNDGGGLYINDTITLTSTRMVNNTAGRYGGGLQVYVGTVSINGGSFLGNHAGANGGAINLNNAIYISGTSFMTNTSDADGGGLLQWNSGQLVTVINARFGYNSGHNGGGMWLGGDATVLNTWFEYNTGFNGGGVWASGNLSVTASTFHANTVYAAGGTYFYGGGVYFSGAALHVANSLFQENSTSCSSCSFPGGGGLYNHATLTATVAGSTFDGNDADYWGGGLLTDANAEMLIQSSTFKNNHSFFGGGIMEQYATIQNTDFISNTDYFKGAGVYMRFNSSMLNVRFIGNSSVNGALAMTQCDPCSFTNVVVLNNTNSSSDYAAIYVSQSPAVRFVQTTINNNKYGMNSGKGVRLESSTVNMTNTLIANQTIGITSTVGSTLTLNAVLYYNTSFLTGGAGATQIALAITGNPAFTADGYHLTAASAAINHGVNSGVTRDLDGNPRPVGTAYDLGAIEYVASRALLPIARRP